MPPMNLTITILGRPVKPVAFGLGVYMAVFMFYNLVDKGVFGNSKWGDVLAVIAGAALALLVTAWVANSQRLAEVGLLLACSVFLIRGTFLILTIGFGSEAVYYQIANIIIAGGSYFLERADPAKQKSGGKP